jgi:hypothetical protein
MSGSEKYEEMSAAEVGAEVEKRGLDIAEGSGVGGRVVTADRIAALVKDDAKRERAKAKEEVVEDEAGDAPETAEVDPDVPGLEPLEEERAGEDAKPNGVIEPTAKSGVKVGDVVLYRDKFNGGTQDARISGIVDEEEGVVDLAVFSGGGGASRREAVPRGPRSGHWMPKGTA